MPDPFLLHLQLSQDCAVVGDFPLCRLLLMNNRHFPWCILVPRRGDVTEIYQLSHEDQVALIGESSILAGTMASLYGAHKLNIAALGNVVPQLHVHHIVRYRHDPAWPAPVWGKGHDAKYSETELVSTVIGLRDVLNRERRLPFTGVALDGASPGRTDLR